MPLLIKPGCEKCGRTLSPDGLGSVNVTCGPATAIAASGIDGVLSAGTIALPCQPLPSFEA